MLNFMHLESLNAVLETGSFSAAGKRLGYTTSAVSQQIAALERNLGVQLFERGPRNLWPTAAAHRVNTAALGVLSQITGCEEEIRAAASGTERGRLRIASLPGIGTRLLPRALAALVRRFPDAEVTVSEKSSTDELTEAVATMRVDVGIISTYTAVPTDWPDRLVATPILEEEIVVIAGANRVPSLPPTLELASLSDAVWVAQPPGTRGRASFEHWCQAVGFNPEVMFETNSFDTIRGLVREDLALGAIPALALGVDRNITMHRLVDVSPRRRIHLISRSSDQNPLVAEAEQVILDSADHFVDWTREGFETYEVDHPLAACLHSGSKSVG